MVNEKGKIELTNTGFNDLFESFMKKCNTYREAYESSEEFHEQTFGDRKFSCYQAFERMRRKLLKRNHSLKTQPKVASF